MSSKELKAKRVYAYKLLNGIGKVNKNLSKALDIYQQIISSQNKVPFSVVNGLLTISKDDFKEHGSEQADAALWRSAVRLLEQLAERSDCRASYCLGLFYYELKKHQEAVSRFEKAAAVNHGGAIKMLCLIYHEGSLKDQDKARSWFFKYRKFVLAMVKKNHHYYLEELADFYSKGVGIKKNKQLAVKYYKQYLHCLEGLARLGRAQAFYRLGVIYESSFARFGVKQDLNRAAGYYRRAVKFGCAAAKSPLLCCQAKIETKKRATAKKRAQENEAVQIVTVDYNAIIEKIEQAKKTSNKQQLDSLNHQLIEAYKQLASQGDSYCMFRLGMIYWLGERGVRKNFGTALLYYRRAADNGYEFAIDHMVSLLVQNPKQFVKQRPKAWFDRYFGQLLSLVEAKEGWAAFALADCYSSGIGVVRNMRKAGDYNRQGVEFYHAEAKSGSPHAMFELGTIYEYGSRGEKQNLHKALKWFKKVVSHKGWEDYSSEVKRVKDKLKGKIPY